MALDLPLEPNDDVDLMLRVVEALVAGDDATAESELAPIAGLTCERKPVVKRPTLPREGWPLGTGATTQSPKMPVRAEVYVRDSFTCSYCSRRTVALDVLKLLSVRFGDSFPLHEHWKMAETHRAHWDIATTLDHVVPVSRGGSWNDVENLAAVCYRCQQQKADHTLEVLGWERWPVASDWDGLVSHYRALWEQLGRPGGDHAERIAAFEQAMSIR